MDDPTKEKQTESQNENAEMTEISETTVEENVEVPPEDSEEVEEVSEVDEIQALESEIAKLKQEVQTNLDGWQRSRAEFTNYKRRTAQELAESRERGALEALTKLLPAIDDFERALDNVPADLREHAWIDGTTLIFKNVQKVLDEYNVSVIDPVGEEFDPNYHEAVGTDSSDEYDSGVVTVTLQKGYRSGERVLRPALVRVAG